MADENKNTEKTPQPQHPAAMERWTELEHLPEWDEEFYLVYTAKKFGKWVMLKTLRPEFRDNPEYMALIEKEFDTRYNLAHPNIIMINDFEEIPGLGRCIITDDVYGLSLRKIMDSGKVSAHHISQLTRQLVNAMQYIQANHIVHHPIRPESIIFTENVENLKLIDVGFDQEENLSSIDVSNDIYNFGMILREALDKSGIQNSRLRKVAERCIDSNPAKRYRNVEMLRLALEGSSSTSIYILIIAFLGIMVAILSILILHTT